MQIHSDDLVCYLAVVDSGSLTKAAEALNLTPSGVSRTLKRLESKLQTTLLNRTTRRLEMTEEGRLFQQKSREIISAIEHTEECLMSRSHQPRGKLRINTAEPFMRHCVVPHVAEFLRRYPEIELELNTSDFNIDLLQERTDVAIRIGPLQDATLHARYLGASRLYLLASPAYLAQHGTPQSWDDLTEHRLLGFSRIDFLNIWPLLNAQGERLKIAPVLSASSGETLRQLALEGLGIVCLSEFMSIQDIQAKRLIPLLEPDLVQVRQPINAVYYQHAELAMRVKCFLDFIQEVMKKYLS